MLNPLVKSSFKELLQLTDGTNYAAPMPTNVSSKTVVQSSGCSVGYLD